MLHVDESTIRRWVKKEALPAVVLPHVNDRQAYRVQRETLDALLETHMNVVR